MEKFKKIKIKNKKNPQKPEETFSLCSTLTPINGRESGVENANKICLLTATLVHSGSFWGFWVQIWGFSLQSDPPAGTGGQNPPKTIWDPGPAPTLAPPAPKFGIPPPPLGLLPARGRCCASPSGNGGPEIGRIVPMHDGSCSPINANQFRPRASDAWWEVKFKFSGKTGSC